MAGAAGPGGLILRRGSCCHRRERWHLRRVAYPPAITEEPTASGGLSRSSPESVPDPAFMRLAKTDGARPWPSGL